MAKWSFHSRGSGMPLYLYPLLLNFSSPCQPNNPFLSRRSQSYSHRHNGLEAHAEADEKIFRQIKPEIAQTSRELSPQSGPTGRRLLRFRQAGGPKEPHSIRHQ
ncbi:hypothetical protein SASPL_117516 [Salvia splendens]|uniref:Uncharacterized protein n=1 Tax=Salvia splendens TaxID=180675 RepID=A0A8X8XVW8_SALSN|nr:hypothetical protein SASPL_117516 [Salvia splendens]